MAFQCQLTRETRLFWAGESYPASNSLTNSWVGGPNLEWLAPRVQLRLTVEGRIDPRTGYVADIRNLDLAARDAIGCHDPSGSDPRSIHAWMQRVFPLIRQRIAPAIDLVALELALSPQQSYLLSRESIAMVIVTRQYEFSAAHRLHSAELTDEENWAVFGKCNNLHGHGHNYVLDVCVGREGDSIDAYLPDALLDRFVRELVIDRLDHKFLNIEVTEFASRNPTVENIARTIWHWLDGGMPPGVLQRIRVYETAKTWADVTRPAETG